MKEAIVARQPGDELSLASKRGIVGYRELDEVEIETINKIKAHSALVGTLIESLRAKNTLVKDQHIYDERWIDIGATEIQIGFMALIRAVAQPTGF